VAIAAVAVLLVCLISIVLVFIVHKRRQNSKAEREAASKFVTKLDFKRSGETESTEITNYNLVSGNVTMPKGSSLNQTVDSRIFETDTS